MQCFLLTTPKVWRQTLRTSLPSRTFGHRVRPFCYPPSYVSSVVSPVHFRYFTTVSAQHSSKSTRLIHGSRVNKGTSSGLLIWVRCLATSLGPEPNKPPVVPPIIPTPSSSSQNAASQKPGSSSPQVATSNAEADKRKSTSSPGTIPASSSTTLDKAQPASSEVAVKKSLWQRVKAEALHYYHGFKLLYLDTKVAVRLGFGVVFLGKALTRRERRQLVRTVADLFRLLPFLVFIIVPFMEFLLPFYLKFFPFMLPSTFQEEKKELEKSRQLLKGKLEMAKFLQNTLHERFRMTQVANAPTVQEFRDFLKQVREAGRLASTQDILKYTRLFEDENTLDSLDHDTLKGICKMLELNSLGPSQLLRFQIRMQMKKLYVDDEIIRLEGVEKLPIWDLQQLCRERGMRALGVSEERLRFQLSQWLELHLDKKVPLMLLLLTRTMYLPETLTTDEQIKEVIGRLPDNVSKGAALKAAPVLEKDGVARVDNQVVYQLLKEEEQKLKVEAKQAKVEAKKKKAEQLADKAPVMEDKAKPLEKAAETPSAKSAAPPVMDPSWQNLSSAEFQPEVTASDLAHIESAIESIVATRTALDEEDLKELKDSLAETAALKHEKMAQLPTSAPEAKTVGHIEMNVQRLVGEVEGMVKQLQSQEEKLQHELEAETSQQPHRVELMKSIEDTKARAVSVEDLLKSLRRLEKAPDEARMQKILDVLDEDHDGQIEMPHVSQIAELLASEKVDKMTGKEVTKVLNTIDKEAFVEDMQKKKQQQQQQKATMESAGGETSGKTNNV